MLAACLLILVAATAGAQTVAVNPNTVVFDPSADHNAVSALTGLPLVSRYALRFYLPGATQPVQDQDLGKPTPGTDGKITITNRALFTGTPIALDTKYVAKVAAVGPAGEGVSAASDPFGNAGPPAAPPTKPALAIR
jgi:hypothetical protein